MNLDDLMDVWRAQDTSPLGEKTLLHLALRQHQAKLQKQRRAERWIIYVMCLLLAGALALFLGIMIYPNDDDVLIVWDYLYPVAGIMAALVAAAAMYALHIAQTRRDRAFGESLRDQLRRRVAQLDALTAKDRSLTRIAVVAIWLCGLAIYMSARRINDVPYNADWPIVLGLILAFALFGALRRRRRWMEREILPRKRRLEDLIQQLNAE